MGSRVRASGEVEGGDVPGLWREAVLSTRLRPGSLRQGPRIEAQTRYR